MPELLPPPTALEQVSDGQLKRYADLVYQRTGIRVSPQKKMLLSNRLRRRLRETGIASFDDYYRHLTCLRSNDPEWDAFLQEITTHETYLFRDDSQWQWFRNVYLAERAAEARGKGSPSLRIWSAACSTGDEPTTIACSIAAFLPNLQQWRIQIVGTDIGVGALEQAQSGVFGERAMRLVPEDYRRRFFTKAKDGQIWQAKPALMSMIAYRQHNLMEPLNERPFDLVFLKNVLIYFDAASKRKVLDNVCRLVRPGGLLAAGAAEGIADMLKGFERLQPWLHRRPQE
ncbi:MAG: protein-glutamate O-methyltransferase CheR [Pirellulales bacterium]|nr:protein-glutamate O-methyltransferase CheR [Pirellulales bacterium]